MSLCSDALDAPPPPRPDVRIILVAAVVLVSVDGAVLIARRPPGKAYAGQWEFPGGKVEAGETPEYALMRELREEMNIETRPTCYYPLGFASHTYTGPDVFGHVLMPVFVCRTWRGDPTPQEGQELKWVPPKQLYNYDFVPADIPLIAQVIDRV